MGKMLTIICKRMQFMQISKLPDNYRLNTCETFFPLMSEHFARHFKMSAELKAFTESDSFSMMRFNNL